MTTITLDNPPVVLYQGTDARVIALEIENFRILAAAGYFQGREFRVTVEATMHNTLLPTLPACLP